MKLFRFYDQGDGGGANGGSEGAGAGGSADGGIGNQFTVPQFSDLNEDNYGQLVKAHEGLSTERDGLKTSYADEVKKLTQKLGDQGNQLAGRKQSEQMMKDDPKGYLESLAKNLNVDVSFGGGKAGPDFAKLGEVFAGGDKAEMAKALKELTANDADAQQLVRDAMKPYIDQFMETQMRSEFPDWDDLKEGRDDLNVRVVKNDVPFSKVLHLAAQAQKIPDILKDHEASVRKKVMKEMADKMQGASGGSGGIVKSKSSDPDNRQVMGNALAAMHENR